MRARHTDRAERCTAAARHLMLRLLRVREQYVAECCKLQVGIIVVVDNFHDTDNIVLSKSVSQHR